MNGTMNRCLKRWWKQLNSTILADTPIDVRATSIYSCRHTFATRPEPTVAGRRKNSFALAFYGWKNAVFWL